MASNVDRLAQAMVSKRSPINIKPSHEGLLHKSLGVKQGSKIPASVEQKAANSSNPLLAKRAQFALNARAWHH